jgi:hypothetical protein
MGRYTLQAGDVRLVTCCDDAFAEPANSLLQAVASFRGRGKGLNDGVTIQFGWSILTLRRQGDELLICEPDFSGDPLTEVREDVTCTLAVLVGQAALINRLGVEPVEVRFDESVLVARGCLADRRVFLQRGDPSPGDSGWYVGPVDSPAPEQKAENFESLPVFELLSRRASLLQVLGLPPGYLTVFDGDEIDAIFDEQDRNVWAATEEEEA